MTRRKPHGQTRGLKHFAPGGLLDPMKGKDMAIRKPTYHLPDDYAPPPADAPSRYKRQKPYTTTTIGKFLTAEEIAQAMDLYSRATPGSFARLCDERIIAPVLPRIEKALGQRMHPRYVAYMVEYVLGLATIKR